MLHRLARQLGETNVARLVDIVPEEDLNKLLAVDYLDGEPWHHVAWLAMHIHNSLLVVLAKFAGMSITEDDFREAAEFLPKYRRPPTNRQTSASPDAGLDQWMRQQATRRHG